MPYDIIKPPFTLKFREMPKKELKAYYAWFLNIMPERIEEMAKVVKLSSGFEFWKADDSVASLESLGRWFVTQVEVRSRTEEEIERIKSSLAFPIDISSEELTNKTFSLTIDVGMYFARVLLLQYPHLKWHQFFGSTRFVDYGQPVLVGFGRVSLNPIRITRTVAYSAADKKQEKNKLKEAYDRWAEMASANLVKEI